MTTKTKPRRWTAEEDAYLSEHWGFKSCKAIANHLGRSASAVQSRGNKKYGDSKNKIHDCLSVSDISNAIWNDPTHYHSVYYWIRHCGLKVRKVVHRGKMRKAVNFNDWWKFVESNPYRFDWANIEVGSLGIEPEWMESIRAKHTNKYIKKNWTSREVYKLVRMAESDIPIEQIARELSRTRESVRSKLNAIGVGHYDSRKGASKNQPLNDDDYRLIESMIKGFETIQSIGQAVGKDIGSLRRFLTVKYGTCSLSKIRKLLLDCDKVIVDDTKSV